MANATLVDESGFRRILARNIRLPLGVGLAGAALFVVLIFYLLYVLSWVEHTDIVIGSTNDAYRSTIDQETGFRGYLLSGDPQFLQPYEQARPRLRADMESLRELVSDNPPQVSRARRIEALQAEWNQYASEMIERRRNGEDVVDKVRDGRGKQLIDGIRQEFGDFVALEQRLRHERNERATDTAILTIVCYVLFSLAFSGILVFFGRRDLLTLSSRYGDSLQKQLAYTEHLQQQAWLREGQSLLAERILGQQALPQIGKQLLEFLGGYLDVAVAALYVREDGGDLLRVATYGFSQAHPHSRERLSASEGLLGQAALGRRLVIFEGLPPDYLKVSSSLGEGFPLSVLAAPTESEGQVNGVLELGFLRALSPRDKAFVESITGNLGVSIEASRYRQRLQEVLAETQQLNEELQVQQEELRAANEELEDQSQVVLQSQADLEVQQTELEQTNLRLNEQTLRLVEQRDALDQQNRALNQARAQLEERAEELQRASRYKSEFLANMSHELRTPLNSALILAKVLTENRKGNLDSEQIRYAQMIYDSGNDLLRLISDILDISKVEAGRLDVHPEPTDIQQLMGDLDSAFREQAEDKGLTFSLGVQPGTPASIHTDQHRAEQVLRNLLSNALKFTERGVIDVQACPASGGVRFEVRDTGIGISAEQQKFIFDAFRQADGSNNRRFGGTGLGLSISRNLAQLLGGHIEVSSELGQGSCFSFWLPERIEGADPEASPAPTPTQTLPQRLPEPPAAPSPAPASRAASAIPDDRAQATPGSRSILVIEDDPQLAQILYELAHELEYRCLIAQTASEGSTLAEEQTPDAILLDIHLPDDSGLALLQRLKETPTTRHIPVHVISALDYSEPALHLGAIGYAQKPATRDELKDVFSKLEAKLTQKVKHVLLVEDNAQQRESISLLIGDEDIRITAVERGEQALELLRSEQFDCMIIDLNLPDMQGNELFERMTRDENYSFPPVIVYTGRDLTRRDEEELLKYSRSIIIKGARSPERLLDEVTLFLHKVESEMSSDRQRMLRLARSQDKTLEQGCVLVVDDDVRNIYALSGALDLKGLKVETARNGQEAIDKLNEAERIDLVLMDIMMPVMDGYEAMRRIRQNPRWKELPIIAVTAKAMKDDQELCMQAGANDYLAKPIDIERLCSLIRVWLPKRRRF
ncbi:response regulator [Pseudomonas sp. RIT-PI-AD]|uniref:response regulator n=1 Tax=Pseudomonas sp. RIT-PI-AD TaxID=3035294 RepID=UPI0021D87207|nr:response regulator [Pseudomonas sp. RIT-PI-AD]